MEVRLTRRGGALVVAAAGRVDFRTVEDFEAVLSATVRSSVDAVVVDAAATSAAADFERC